MATFISLLKFTDKGMATIKDSPNRLDNAKKGWQAAGGNIKAFYLTTGQYDAVVISEAPDDATVARLALQTGAAGAVKTETFRAFTEDEYRKIIAALP